MDKLFDDIVYEIPFLDYNVKNTSIDNKIQIGHPLNPGSVTIIDGLNIGNNSYDSAFIIASPEYIKDGHSKNFLDDFEKRYNMKIDIIEFESRNIDSIISIVQNNNYNIFLKLDLCSDEIYNILSKLEKQKFLQIVCTELPLPKYKYQTEVLNNYMGLETTQKLKEEIGIENKKNNLKSYHYLTHYSSRWSIKEENWQIKSQKEKPPLQLTTFLNPSLSKYIKILDVGDSSTPQKHLLVDMNYSANIIFINEFDIYPDRFSCYINNENNNQNKIIITRTDKTRMGWGQNLKAITNAQLLPRTSTCVFVRKDIFQNNRFTSIEQNNIPPNNLDIHMNAFNSQNINRDFSYWSPINTEGYKRLLTNSFKDDFIKENFETKLVPKKKIKEQIINKRKTNEKKKKETVSLILPSNTSIVKLLKKKFKDIKIIENSRNKKTLRSLYLSLNDSEKKKFKITLIKIVLDHILVSNSIGVYNLSGDSIIKEKEHIIVNNKNINITRILLNKNFNMIFTDTYIENKKKIKGADVEKYLKLREKLSIKFMEEIINSYQDYRIFPEILMLFREII